LKQNTRPTYVCNLQVDIFRLTYAKYSFLVHQHATKPHISESITNLALRDLCFFLKLQICETDMTYYTDISVYGRNKTQQWF